MNIHPRRYAYCVECDKRTVQWLTSIQLTRSRGCWGPRGPFENYTCPECGGTDTVAVWTDKEAWRLDDNPDFVGCHDCHIMYE